LLATGLWTDKYGLIVSMVGVGVAWASILALPYALLANVVPPNRMGFFMGVFNYFIVLPQILAATLLGPLVDGLFGGAAMPVVMLGGASMLVAAAMLAFVKPQE
jgi:maltose/moltooligosaccharide transporter